MLRRAAVRLGCPLALVLLAHSACDTDAVGEVVDAGHDVTRTIVPDTGSPDTGESDDDAGEDTGVDAGHDAGHDGGHDAGHDAGMDSGVATLVITPATGTLDLQCAPLQLHATAVAGDGTTKDVTTLAHWLSSAPSIALVGGSTGTVTGVSMGTVKISVTYGGLTESQTLNVVSTPVETLTVTPATASVAVGATQQFTATALLTDGTMCTLGPLVAWTSSSPSFATVSSSGVAKGVGAGMTTITANLGMAGSALLTVH